MPGKKKRVTTADIARLAGVSRTAVSLALADRRDVSISEATRERIRRCAETLGYFHSLLGEGFLRGRSKLIGVLMVMSSYCTFLDCVAGINESLAEADFFPLIMSPDWMDRHIQSGFDVDRNRGGELCGLRRLLEYQVDGLLYFSTGAKYTAACVRELSSRSIPMVILGGVDPFPGAVDVVGGDNEATGRMAADHLLSAGCSSFAYGKPADAHPLDSVVHASFAARLAETGHACGEFTLDAENPGDLAGLLSGLVRPPAGVFCARDNIAALTLRAASELGWWVPGDCAVAAMGQTGISLFNALPITTVNRNSFVTGKKATELLIRRIEGFAEQPQKILVPPSLEVRASSVSDVSWLQQSRRRMPLPASP